MSDLDLGNLGIKITLDEGEPVSARFTLPDGSVVTRPFENGELDMRLGLGLGMGYQAAPVGGEVATAPVNTGLPVISGTAQSGQTLSTTNGTWDDGGAAISGYTYQWKEDGVAISGAMASSFLLTDTQVGKVITVTVTASNAEGSTSATSAGTDEVAAAPAASDPHFANVVLLCGFDGTNGSTSFVDESSSGKALTAVGNAQIDTAQFKFGTSSLLLDGSGDRVTAADSPDWQLGPTSSSPWTVECWVRWSTLDANSRGIMGHNGGAGALGWFFTASSVGELSFLLSTNNSSFDVSVTTSGAGLTTGVWYHLAADHDATGKIRLYVDGSMLGSATPADSAIRDRATPFAIGAQGSLGQQDMAGWIDEVRITKGVARYASDAGFTPPTAAFPRA